MSKRAIIIGGIAQSLVRFRGDLIRDLMARGYHVTAASAPTSDEAIAALRDWGVDYVPLPIDRTSLNPVKDLRTLYAIHRLVSRIRPDVVIAYTIKPVIYGGLAIRLCRPLRFLPMVTGLGFAFHGGSTLRNMLAWLAVNLYRQALKPAHRVIFQNPDDRNVFVRKGIVPVAKTRVVNGSGVNLGHYARVPLPDGPVSFLLAARLLKAKGICEYVAAARQVKVNYPDAEFVIIGHKDTSPDAIPAAMIADWATDGVVRYDGGVADIRPWLARCSVYVLPSYSEGMPRTVLEAMAMGRPVITTDVPGCRQTVVPGENGCLIPARDVGALVRAMEAFLADPASIPVQGEASYRMALEKFDVQAVNRDILQELD
ncbi:MAG: glycosyltransferase family 4 protein [Lautropia sp.]|nr:glycosyltransferase family 4 protein [Lautropia sp.]